MTQRLVFLHLSDIHFAKAKLGSAYDLDEDLRMRLEDDAETVAKSLGPPAAIFISGDIAYSGVRPQYDIAREWLNTRLCKRVGSDPASIWAVPGNHDVDQSIIEQKPSFRDVRQRLRECDVDAIESTLADRLAEPELFYDPLAEYNRFALEIGCDTHVGEPIWRTGDEFRLNDGSILRVYGLNSSLISDSNDHPDTGKMVLGKYQCKIPQLSGVANMIVCHHPFDWIRDADEVERMLQPRSSLQLFGHKHSHKLKKVDDALLQVSAGAVHPSRSESGWEPRFNWLSLCVEENGSSRSLRVDVYPRIWNPNTQSFTADAINCDESKNCKSFLLKLPDWAGRSPDDHSTGPNAGKEEGVADSTILDASSHSGCVAHFEDNRGTPVMNPNRTITQRYLQLGYATRTRIAIRLDLIQDGDDRLQDHMKLRTQLLRAQEAGQLAMLWDLVEEAHNDGRYPVNPFKREE
tara:strand:+ start:19610 stop:20998 length:1389 start_codon:yes stop_codon:yes gene_type:complete